MDTEYEYDMIIQYDNDYPKYDNSKSTYFFKN